MLEIFGSLPLWLILIIGLIIVIVAWKLIKFAIKILLVIIVFIVILLGLDALNVFNMVQNLISNIL